MYYRLFIIHWYITIASCTVSDVRMVVWILCLVITLASAYYNGYYSGLYYFLELVDCMSAHLLAKYLYDLFFNLFIFTKKFYILCATLHKFKPTGFIVSNSIIFLYYSIIISYSISILNRFHLHLISWIIVDSGDGSMNDS